MPSTDKNRASHAGLAVHANVNHALPVARSANFQQPHASPIAACHSATHGMRRPPSPRIRTRQLCSLPLFLNAQQTKKRHKAAPLTGLFSIFPAHRINLLRLRARKAILSVASSKFSVSAVHMRVQSLKR